MELQKLKDEINKELANKENFTILIQTTFKGFEAPLVKRALLEGMMRGFSFKDFLEKNIYAIKFGTGYSLVTSIDHARKIGMRSGVVGKSAPIYAEKEKGGILSCTVVIKRKVAEHIGDYAATVFFDEYSTGKNLWASKPRTMIAKVAESHALRMACPEEMAQIYVEEEMEKEVAPVELPPVAIEEYKKKLEAATDVVQLGKAWSALPIEVKKVLEVFKDELKNKLI